MRDSEPSAEDLVIDGPEVDSDASDTSSDEIVPKKKHKKRRNKFIVDDKVVRRKIPIEEEKALYNKSRSFDERLSIASRRYKQRAGLSGAMMTVFDNYLVYGAIGVWPDMITGDADPVSGAHKVDSYGRKYVLDVQFIVKAFLSTIQDITPDERAFDVIRNFLRYLVEFEVCPEYVTDISAAAELCELAKGELKLLSALGSALPGRFNKTCSALTGGYYAALNAIPPKENWGSLEYFAEQTVSSQKLLSSETVAFEVVELVNDNKDYLQMITKEWTNPAWPVSETDSNSGLVPERRWTFIVDHCLAEHLKQGIKMEVVVRVLENGEYYFDKVNAVLNSFYEHYEKPDGHLYQDM